MRGGPTPRCRPFAALAAWPWWRRLDAYSNWKLLQEAEVVLVEQSDVVDAVFQNRDTLDPHAERESRITIGIVSDRFEHRRVHHTAAADFEPSRALADRAAAAMAKHAADEDLGARFGIREEARANLHLCVRFEQLARERGQRALQIGHGDAVAYDESLDLLEHRRVRQVEVVAAIHLAGHDDTHRGLMALHVADLHRRGVRAQECCRTTEARSL